MRRSLLICLICGLMTGVSFAAKQDAAKEPFRLAKLERGDPKLPDLVHKQPLFALAVVGTDGEKKIWLVADSSEGEGERDVLYADLNSNADLTDDGERIERGDDGRFQLPDITDGTGTKHTKVAVTLRGTGNRTRHTMQLYWRGKRKMSSGYPVDPSDGYMRFASSVDEAPIVWFNGKGPMQFQRWGGDPFVIGEENSLSVFLGQKGVGKKSFTAFTKHVLKDDEVLPASVVYTAMDGEKKEVPAELPGRC